MFGRVVTEENKVNVSIFGFYFLWQRNKLLPSFSLAQRKEAKETSTLTKPSPIWEGLTAPTRRSFIKVSSPHQRGGLLFFRLTPGDWRSISVSFPFISVYSVINILCANHFENQIWLRLTPPRSTKFIQVSLCSHSFVVSVISVISV